MTKISTKKNTTIQANEYNNAKPESVRKRERKVL